MLALLDNRPVIFSLRELFDQFLFHRREIVYKRSIYDLKKAEAREHLLAGFIIALKNIDEVIALLKQSANADEAIVKLNKRFLLTIEQGKAILEMRLQRLTGLEQEKIYAEIEEIKQEIARLRSIIDNPEILKQEIIKELNHIKSEYNDKRRTQN